MPVKNANHRGWTQRRSTAVGGRESKSWRQRERLWVKDVWYAWASVEAKSRCIGDGEKIPKRMVRSGD
ncbi:MAG TPA: hypothetical protein VFX23_03430 [Limnobacter sp.]|nr:hypothetical protein [Limnobacter sp.]